MSAPTTDLEANGLKFTTIFKEGGGGLLWSSVGALPDLKS